MRNPQAGTSVLAALVFVAIFVLFISGYKIASQPAGGQSAAVASTIVQALPSTCAGGDVHTVDMSSGAGAVNTAVCATGSDSPACAAMDQTKCVVRYCPPASYVTGSACFTLTACDPADNGDTCIRTALQNATQSVQVPNILAARLIDDKGETIAATPYGEQALKALLSESGRSAVASIIEATGDAAEESGYDAGLIRDVAHAILSDPTPRESSDPVAQISCQPKIAQSGMKIALAFGCANSVMSASEQFDTGGRLWGATEVRLDPGLPNGTMIYGLSCSDGRTAVSATCSVTVTKPFMLFTSKTGSTGSALAWVTRGMDLCEMNAIDNASITASFGNPVPQSGALVMPTVLADTDVVLTCTSVSGEIKEARTTIPALH